MKEVYDFLARLEDMCNRSQHRSVTIEDRHIYAMKKMIEEIPDTIKMLREDKEQLQTENTKLKQDKQELQKIVDALEMAKQNMPKGTQFVIVAEEDYLRNIGIINERKS